MVDLDTRAAGLAGIAIGLAVDTADRGPDIGAEAVVAFNTDASLTNEARRTLTQRRDSRPFTLWKWPVNITLDRSGGTLPVMVDLDPGAAGLTAVAVGLAINATDRCPDCRADTLFDLNTKPVLANQPRRTLLGRGGPTGTITGRERAATFDRGRLALAVVIDPDSSTTRLAGVAVSLAVHPTDWRVDLRTGTSLVNADAVGTDLARLAGMIRVALRLGLALALMGDLDLGTTRFADVAVGLAVHPTDRGVNIWAYTRLNTATLTTPARDRARATRAALSASIATWIAAVGGCSQHHDYQHTEVLPNE